MLLCTHFRLAHESQLHKPTSDQTVLGINSIAISTNGIYTCTKEDITKGPVGTYAMLPWYNNGHVYMACSIQYVEVPTKPIVKM